MYPISDRSQLMNILFCHGKEGSPDGTKARALKALPNAGIVATPRLTNSFSDYDFIKDLGMVMKVANTVDIIVGSSRGGALVCQMNIDKRKILIAPAWKKFKVIPHLTSDDIILHCKEDKLVPYKDSVQLANMFGCKLIECGINHRMSDSKTLNTIKNIIIEATNG